MSRKILLIFFALLLFSACTYFNRAHKAHTLGPLPKNNLVPKNIIFMIVDGMGFEYVKAARIYNGQEPLSYENFPCKTKVTTCAYEGSLGGGRCNENSDHVTDSAAAATAIASGVKVSNDVISQSIPGAKTNLTTILEIAKTMNKSTGVVVTKLFTDATPAAFVGHAPSRKETKTILKYIFEESTPNVIFGADNKLHQEYAKKSRQKYNFISTAQDLKTLSEKIAAGASCSGQSCAHVYGGFGQHSLIPGSFHYKSGLPLEITPHEEFAALKVPHLSEMTAAALKILNKNSEGFFLMVESSLPDKIGHNNEQLDESPQTPSAIAVLVREMMEVEKTAQILQDFVMKNPDTLVIVTADHETGGLIIEDHKTDCLGKPQCLPSVRWTSAKYEPEIKDSLARHTAVDVPLYAIGANSQNFCQEKIDNTDIKKFALGHIQQLVVNVE